MSDMKQRANKRKRVSKTKVSPRKRTRLYEDISLPKTITNNKSYKVTIHDLGSGSIIKPGQYYIRTGFKSAINIRDNVFHNEIHDPVSDGENPIYEIKVAGKIISNKKYELASSKEKEQYHRLVKNAEDPIVAKNKLYAEGIFMTPYDAACAASRYQSNGKFKGGSCISAAAFFGYNCPDIQNYYESQQKKKPQRSGKNPIAEIKKQRAVMVSQRKELQKEIQKSLEIERKKLEQMSLEVEEGKRFLEQIKKERIKIKSPKKKKECPKPPPKKKECPPKKECPKPQQPPPKKKKECPKTPPKKKKCEHGYCQSNRCIYCKCPENPWAYQKFPKLRYLSLCSGIGGFELAILRVFPDAKCLGYSEVDKDALSVYQHHFPSHKHLGNIAQIDFTVFKNQVDLLVSGPCNESKELIRAIDECQPRFIIVENAKQPGQYCKPIFLDMSQFSAQHKKCQFWTNFPVSQQPTLSLDNTPQLKDKLLPLNIFRGEHPGLTEKDVESVRKNQDKCHDSNHEKSKHLTHLHMPINTALIDRRGILPVYRRLMPVECERLQGYPDRWTINLPKSDRYGILGDNTTQVDTVTYICKALYAHITKDLPIPKNKKRRKQKSKQLTAEQKKEKDRKHWQRKKLTAEHIIKERRVCFCKKLLDSNTAKFVLNTEGRKNKTRRQFLQLSSAKAMRQKQHMYDIVCKDCYRQGINTF